MFKIADADTANSDPLGADERVLDTSGGSAENIKGYRASSSISLIE